MQQLRMNEAENGAIATKPPLPVIYCQITVSHFYADKSHYVEQKSVVFTSTGNSFFVLHV